MMTKFHYTNSGVTSKCAIVKIKFKLLDSINKPISDEVRTWNNKAGDANLFFVEYLS